MASAALEKIQLDVPHGPRPSVPWAMCQSMYLAVPPDVACPPCGHGWKENKIAKLTQAAEGGR